MTPGFPKNQDYFRKGAQKSPKSSRFSHSAGSVAAAAAKHRREECGLAWPGQHKCPQSDNNQHIMRYSIMSTYTEATQT